MTERFKLPNGASSFSKEKYAQEWFDFANKVPEIIEATEQHDAAVLEISASTLGDGYISNASELRIDSRLAVCVMNGEVIGFANGHLLDKVPVKLVQLIPFNRKLGLVANVAVHPSYQRMGVGKKLVTHLVEYLKQKGAEVALAEVWKYDSTVGAVINAEAVVKAIGFQRLCDVQGYWSEECDTGRFKCPARTSGCRCSIALFVKDL